jgi:hypothetical protein
MPQRLIIAEQRNYADAIRKLSYLYQIKQNQKGQKSQN